MARGLNRGEFIGNAGRDPNFKYTQGGVAVCDVSIACTESTGSGDNKKEETTWVRLTFWREAAEVINQYFKKGMQIWVEGTLAVNPYIDKNNQPAATLDCTVRNFRFLGSKQGDENGSQQQQPQAQQQQQSNGNGGGNNDQPW